MAKHRFRAWVYYWIDRADTYCLNHSWVPKPVVLTVGRAWDWMMGRHTWTAVGNDEYGPETREVGFAEIPCRWNDEGDATDWIRLSRTHPWQPTCDEGCVIHYRTGHHMHDWPLLWRGDRGIFERTCPHGIGHPDPDQGPYWKRTGQDWQWIHGCDGCCRKSDKSSHNMHPDAPHGFDRNASHDEGRYVCDCEGWKADDE